MHKSIIAAVAYLFAHAGAVAINSGSSTGAGGAGGATIPPNPNTLSADAQAITGPPQLVESEILYKTAIAALISLRPEWKRVSSEREQRIKEGLQVIINEMDGFEADEAAKTPKVVDELPIERGA
jgi:hypothetical protein